MKTTSALSILGLATTALLAIGCGDGPQCPSELVLVIQSPLDGATVGASADSDANTAGLQTNVQVRSNFGSGSDITLSVTDESSGAVAQHSAMTNDEGEATFINVTLPSGSVALDATGSSKCGLASDSSTLTVITDGACTLTIDEGPITNDFYAPIPVLNSTNDSNLTLPNFQANVTVAAAPGFSVEFFVLDVDAGSEASIGVMSTDASGEAKFAATLAQGRQVLRATCSQGAINAASASHTVQVDTVVPVCTLTNPSVGVTVTPDDDDDDNAAGIQMTWTGTADAAAEDDVEGEAASFFRDSTEFIGTAVAASGDSSASAEFTAPGAYELAFDTQDHAGNLCSGGFTATVVMSGCAISVNQPTGAGTTNGTITSDSDGVGANGLQADITVQVGTECAGQDVFVDCGQGETSAVAPGTGTTVIENVTMNPLAESQGDATCNARVVSTDNFQTSNAAVIPYDTAGPNVLLRFVNPATLQCGDTLVDNMANDADDVAAGFQIAVDIQGGGVGDTPSFQLINSACVGPNGCSVAYGGVTLVTLELGDNDIQAVAVDPLGNIGASGACNINLTDIDVTIDPPVSTGQLNLSHGTVNGSDELEVTVCGTVSEDTVILTVSLDGGAPQAATVNAGAWCTDAPVAFSAGAHTVFAEANSTLTASVGNATANVDVDITAPNQPTGFVASSPDRQSIDASWSAQADAASFMLRVSETAFTDANFQNEGTEYVVGAATSGSATQLRIGTPYYIGVAAVDSGGNVSIPATLGTIVPLLDQTGNIVSPGYGDAVNKVLGHDMTYADFDGDGFDDLAIGSPYATVGTTAFAGVVRIYRGSAAGIGATPDLTITGPESVTVFGTSLTALNWGGGAEDGLAIGAPFGDNGNGEVYVFHDTTIATAMAGGTTLVAASADMTLRANAADGANWFTGGGLGQTLASGPINADAVDDLIIGVRSGGAGVGGVAMIYGGTPSSSSILLSTNIDAGMAGLVGHVFQNPEVLANGGLLGHSVEYLGRTSNTASAGDIAVTYAEDAMDTIDDRVFILRGRTTMPAAGIDFTTLTAADLTVVLSGSTGVTLSAFGESMGSIQDQGIDGFRDILISKGGGGDSRLFIIDGSLTGTLALSNAAGFMANIAPTSGARFATGVANNAEIANPDIDNDGLEDLLVVGGQSGVGDGVQLHIWLSADIPSGPDTSASATHQISAPSNFDGIPPQGQKRAREVQWAGDVNNDGLADVVWADYYHAAGGALEGVFEVLWDASL